MNDLPTGARLDRAKDLLRTALELEPAAAAAHVRGECRDDPSLGDYVIRLLSGSTHQPGSFGDVRATAADFVASLHPQEIRGYRVLEVLGEGGMGTVYLCEQTEPVRREVAIKLVKPGMDSGAVLARFEQERQALAKMEHDGIARVHECGASADGRPFLVMEVVRGVPLTDYCDARALSIAERIALLQQVCAAVQHAHQKGVVHRDLKPSNVLAVEVDAGPRVKVIDFGLAKAVQPDLAEAPLLTTPGVMLGTVEYMSPEQADPGRPDVDTRADVYSLGVMLYELLVGSLPFTDAELRRRGLLEMQRVIQTVEPPRPSARFARLSADERQRIGAARRCAPAVLDRLLRQDLDWIVATAMAKERERRYQSPGELAADLQRFLAFEPVLAGPPSARYRLRKFVRRNRVQVGAAIVVFVTALAAVGVSLAFAVAKGELAVAEAAARREADDNSARLGRKVREFDLLSGVVRFEAAREAERRLFPPWPEHTAAMQQWLGEAQGLAELDGRIETALAELRKRALPRTDARRDADRRAHPRWPEAERLQGRIAAGRRAAAVRAGEPLVLPSLPSEAGSLSADVLWQRASRRVGPRTEHRSEHGQERLGLAYAEAAVAAAEGTPGLATCLEMVAWARAENGDDAGARVAAQRLLASVGPDLEEGVKAIVDRLEAAIAGAPAALAADEAALTPLLAEIDAACSHAFEQPAERFLHDTLARLHDDLRGFAARQVRAVERRLAWARRIRELSLRHPNARHPWPEVRTAIAASERYRGRTIGLHDDDVLGLVPIGCNPATGLWEFYHLASAVDADADPAAVVIPQHAADGSLPIDESTGIVLVLLPGGAFQMGAQSADPTGPNFDPDAPWYVQPLHGVWLSPFFIGRYEITQQQWARLWQGDEALRWPSVYRRGAPLKNVGETPTGASPVDQVDWRAATDTMRQWGLVLPTEAQWEHACRAGTTTPWPWPFEELGRHANLADQKAKRARAEWQGYEAWDDGFVIAARVGSLQPNAFGLFDLCGNVCEWVRDGVGSYEWPVREGDGERSELASVQRCTRGGSFLHAATYARSAMRTATPATLRGGHVGLRAARSLLPIEQD